MSLENLLIILPTGFMSKNTTGLLNIDFNILYNNMLLDYNIINAKQLYFKIAVKITSIIRIRIFLNV